MGHKVHPVGFRLGVIRTWDAKWYSDRRFNEFLHEDLAIRKAIFHAYSEGGISKVEFDRQATEITVTIHTSRPGIVIGRGGQRVEETRTQLEKITPGKRIRLNIQEIRQPELDAQLVAKNVAEQISRRVAFRRVMKQVASRTMQAGAKGIKIACAGRLGGAEIARRERLHLGRVPLHTLRANIDYGFEEAHTLFGRIGIKVWVYKGDVYREPQELPGTQEVPVSAPVVETAKPAAQLAEVSSLPAPEDSKSTGPGD